MATPDLDQMCAAIIELVDGALACGVVDFDTGRSKALQDTDSYFSQHYLDAAVTALEVFRGSRPPEEFLLAGSADGTLQFMKRIPGTRAVVILVTDESTDHKLSWTSLRAASNQLKTSSDPRACSGAPAPGSRSANSQPC